MRITIENIEEQGSFDRDTRKITFESKNNDMDIMTIVEELRGVLIAYGYHNENVDEFLLTCYNNYQGNSLVNEPSELA
tara:strand:+ start:7254 stop:7487 length:234 start_codon:yes stop_codon:yes gene_type:complete